MQKWFWDAVHESCPDYDGGCCSIYGPCEYASCEARASKSKVDSASTNNGHTAIALEAVEKVLRENAELLASDHEDPIAVVMNELDIVVEQQQ